MANRYFVGGGTGDYNSTTNWSDSDGGSSGSSVPGSADDVFLTATSGDGTLTVNVASAAKSIDCTGFTGTLTLGANLTVSGSITLVSGMTFTPSTYTVLVKATGTLTSGGKEFYALTIDSVSGANTTTLGDNVTVNNTLTVGDTSGNTTTLNGNTLIAKGDVTKPASSYTVTGTTTIQINGSGNQTISFFASTDNYPIRNPIEFKSTGGTVTFASGTHRIAGTTTNTSGTIDLTTNTTTVIYRADLVGNISAGGLTYYTLDFRCGNGNTITLTGDITINNLLTINATAGNGTYNGYNLNVKKDFTLTASGYNTVGTTVLNVNSASGDQTLTFNTNASTAYGFGLSTTINSAGTVSIAGTGWYYKTGTLTYTAGTVDAGTSTLSIVGSCTLNTDGIDWYNITVTSGTATLSGNATVTNTLTINASQTLALGSNTLTLQGNLVNNGTLNRGTGTVIIDGNSTLSGNNINFHILTISGTSRTVTFTAGKVYGVNTFNAVQESTILQSSSGGVAWSITQSSGLITSVSNCTISDSTATGGAAFYAYTTAINVDSGGNTGWIFAEAVVSEVTWIPMLSLLGVG